MKLYEAIEYAINKDGIQIICEQRFANYLADLQAYETPAVKRVVATIIHDGYCNKLYHGLESHSYELDFNDVSHQLAHTAGFQDNIVQFVLNSILYATHKITKEPYFEYNPIIETPTCDNITITDTIEEVKERSFISKKDIEEFFDLEAEAAKNRWEATMKLSIKDRIRKRKAIQNVYLDKNYNETSENGYRLIKVTMNVNLSDFKEGECLLLHKENTSLGIICTLFEFQEDDTIILEVFPPNLPSDLESYYDVPLLLDKDKVDLRNNVYYPFIHSLPVNTDDFWKELILNSCPRPNFDNIEECEEIIKQVINHFNLSLLPKQEEAILKCMQAQDYYMIQGPPGTGKSFVLGIIIFDELLVYKHNVIVIGPNHMAINNAMTQFVKLVPNLSPFTIKVGQSYNAPTIKVTHDGEELGIKNVPRLNTIWAKNFKK